MKKKSSKSAPDAQRLVCSLMSFPCRWGGDLSKCFNLIWPHEQGGLEQQQRYLLGQSHFSCETRSPHHIPSSGTLFISRELIQNIACNLTKQRWGGRDACVTSTLCKTKIPDRVSVTLVDWHVTTTRGATPVTCQMHNLWRRWIRVATLLHPQFSRFHVVHMRNPATCHLHGITHIKMS